MVFIEIEKKDSGGQNTCVWDRVKKPYKKLQSYFFNLLYALHNLKYLSKVTVIDDLSEYICK